MHYSFFIQKSRAFFFANVVVGTWIGCSIFSPEILSRKRLHGIRIDAGWDLRPSEEDAITLLSSDAQLKALLKDLEVSKRPTTRTTYEVNVFHAYTKLVNIARFDEEQYA